MLHASLVGLALVAGAPAYPWCGYHPLRVRCSCRVVEGEAALARHPDRLVIRARDGLAAAVPTSAMAVFREGDTSRELVDLAGGSVFRGRRVRACLGSGPGEVTYVVILRGGP